MKRKGEGSGIEGERKGKGKGRGRVREVMGKGIGRHIQKEGEAKIEQSADSLQNRLMTGNILVQ